MLGQKLFSSFACVTIMCFTFSAIAQRSSSPALVTPPDILSEEDTSGSVDDSTLTPPTLGEIPADARLDELPSSNDLNPEEEPIQTQNTEPPPQIKKKRTTIEPKFRPESRYIEHPNAEKGLIKIDKNRVYHYKVEASPKDSVGSLRFGFYEPSDLSNPEDSNLTFDTLYDETSFPIILYDYERIFSKKFGQLNWKLGGGFYLAQGKGQFANNANLRAPEETPQEKFTLVVFPLNVGLSYKFKFWPNQWIVPYAEGGLDAFAFAEFRDDDNNPDIGARLGLAPSAHFSLGGSLALGKNARSFLDLDREYGINALYITGEYRNYIALSDKYDFSGDVISGGLTAEY